MKYFNDYHIDSELAKALKHTKKEIAKNEMILMKNKKNKSEKI